MNIEPKRLSEEELNYYKEVFSENNNAMHKLRQHIAFQDARITELKSDLATSVEFIRKYSAQIIDLATKLQQQKGGDEKCGLSQVPSQAAGDTKAAEFHCGNEIGKTLARLASRELDLPAAAVIHT